MNKLAFGEKGAFLDKNVSYLKKDVLYEEKNVPTAVGRSSYLNFELLCSALRVQIAPRRRFNNIGFELVKNYLSRIRISIDTYIYIITDVSLNKSLGLPC